MYGLKANICICIDYFHCFNKFRKRGQSDHLRYFCLSNFSCYLWEECLGGQKTIKIHLVLRKLVRRQPSRNQQCNAEVCIRNSNTIWFIFLLQLMDITDELSIVWQIIQWKHLCLSLMSLSSAYCPLSWLRFLKGTVHSKMNIVIVYSYMPLQTCMTDILLRNIKRDAVKNYIYIYSTENGDESVWSIP